MYLTQQNARQYLGKTLDCDRRLFHHYPLEVVVNRNGEYCYKDATGTYIRVPDEQDAFNSVYFDYTLN